MAKRRLRENGMNWLLPILYALPILGAVAAALFLWGDKLRELIGIAVKLAVIA